MNMVEWRGFGMKFGDLRPDFHQLIVDSTASYTDVQSVVCGSYW